MPDASTLTWFAGAALVLLLTPGPAVLYIVTRSVEQGRLAGLVSSLGIQVGSMCHVLAAALGISAMLVTSAMAFHAVKYAGAAYLLYLSALCFLRKQEDGLAGTVRPQRLTRVFAQGVLVNLLNPKSAVFFLAFLPQFVEVSRGAVWKQVLLLGLLFACLAAVTETAWALAAGTAGQWLRRQAAYRRRMRYLSGGVYLVLGLAAAFSGSHKGK